tara:strand:- start:2281 stop:2655 length:375 start_codon:yes stop_codon:yes gene_type:complete
MIFSTVANIFGGWLERRGRVKEAKTNAEITRIEKQAQTEGNYDIEAQRQRQHTILDEILAIVILMPFIAGFLPYPAIQASIRQGWSMLKEAPPFYQVLFVGIYAATFGLRWLISGKFSLSKKDK